MRVLLLRHGETKGNREKRYVGNRTDEGLTLEERERFLKASEERKAAASGLWGCVEEIYISPMKRCTETAELVFPPRWFPECQRILVPGLTECDFGSFEYKNYIELNGNADYQRFIDSGGTDGFPGGERVEQFKARCVKAFGQAAAGLFKKARDSEKTAAFVVHGGTIMAVMEAFAKPGGNYFSWQVKNGCGYLCRAVPDLGMPFGFYLTDAEKISV